MTWRVAPCLDELLKQWNAAHPGRSKASDGSIGDAAHAARTSDHNPWVIDDQGVGVVTARDFTHDPAHGADADQLAEALKQRKDPRVKYVIRNRRIWSLARDAEGWRPYTGDNPHTKHAHVSCSPVQTRYDDTRPWNLSTGSAGGSTGQPPEEEGMAKEDADRVIAEIRKQESTPGIEGQRYADLRSLMVKQHKELLAAIEALKS